jgi:8-oxo-dGTP diphosphatase
MNKSYNPSKHNDARPNVGVTIVPIIYDEELNQLQTIIYRRSVSSEQFAGKISLPNGPYDRQKVKTSEEAAENALKDKVNISIPHIEQLYTFSGDYIDPNRINTINIAYWTILRKEDVVQHQDPTFETEWVSIDSLLARPEDQFAFNHKEVLEMALERVKSQAEYKPLALDLLPVQTTIPAFKKLVELLIDDELNSARFRDRIKKSGILTEIKGVKVSGRSNKSQAYRKNPDYDGQFHPRSFTKPS